MAVAMASIDCVPFKNQVDTLHTQFKCDFCPFAFQTKDDFNAHVLEHFVKKNCLNCNKLLLRIGSQWYQLHVDDELDDDKDGLELDSIAQINVEKLEVEVDVDVDFDDRNDHDIILDDKANDAINDSDSTAEPQSEQMTKTKSKKRKRSKVKTEPQPKPQENNQTKPTQPRRKGPLPRVKCRICERIILKYNFDLHLQKMHVPNVIMPKELVKCETCGKGFANAGNLKIHRSIHTGIKRFVCSYCGTSFRQLFHLTEHINGHTGNTPYECTVCTKRFTRHQILKAHQRVHTGEKPHTCGIEGCDRAYAYDIDLKRHKFSAHGIYSKKHICSFCEKVFSEKKLLRKHLESHSAGNIRVPCKNNE